MSTTDQPLRIVIADDHQMFTEGLVSLLSDEPWLEIVGTAVNGNDLLKQLPSLLPDLILMDINMPEMDGLEATKAVVSDYPNVKVLMLTMLNDPKLIAKLVESGAHGYVLKNTDKAELLDAIKSLAAGDSYFSKEVTQSIMNSFRKDQKRNAPKSPLTEVKITARELDVLRLIAQEMTAAEIAAKLFISQNTVDTHRKNLISKLGVRNTVGLVRHAIENGLLE